MILTMIIRHLTLPYVVFFSKIIFKTTMYSMFETPKQTITQVNKYIKFFATVIRNPRPI